MMDARHGTRRYSVDVDIRMSWVRDLEVYGVTPAPISSEQEKPNSIIIKMGGRSSLEHGLPSKMLKRLDFAYARERVGLLKTVLCLTLPMPLKPIPKKWLSSVVL